jgi:hypothetical protein
VVFKLLTRANEVLNQLGTALRQKVPTASHVENIKKCHEKNHTGLELLKTSHSSFIVIPSSFDREYSPGHSSRGDRASLLERKVKFGVIQN